MRARATATLVLAAVLALSGCTQVGDEPGTLSVMDYYTAGASHDTIDGILRRCGDRAGVEIQRQSMPREQLMSKSLQLAAARDLPGLLMLDNPDLQQIAGTGALRPLRDLGVSTDGYFDAIRSAGTYDGETYAVGMGVNALALFYNRDLLARAGVEPPRTWAELRAAAQALKDETRYGLGFAAPATEEGTWQFEPFLWSNGGDLERLAAPAAVEALEFWTGLVEDGLASRSVVNWTQSDVIDQFAGGHVAMMVNGSWAFANLDVYDDLRYGVVPLPVPEAGDTLQAPLGGEVWTVPRTSERTERTATAVLRCMLSDRNLLTWAEGNAVVPTRTDVAARYADQNPRMRTFVRTVRSARARTEVLAEDYPQVSKAVWTAIQESLVGAEEPRHALATAQRAVRDLRQAEADRP